MRTVSLDVARGLKELDDKYWLHRARYVEERGWIPPHKYVCPKCEGKRWIDEWDCLLDMRFSKECDLCNGTGKWHHPDRYVGYYAPDEEIIRRNRRRVQGMLNIMGTLLGLEENEIKEAIRIPSKTHFVQCICGVDCQGFIKKATVELRRVGYSNETVGAIGRCENCGKVYYWLV